MKRGAYKPVELLQLRQLRVFQFYLVLASVAQRDGIRQEAGASGLMPLYRGMLFFCSLRRRVGRQQQWLLVGRYERDRDGGEERFRRRVEQVVLAILSKMADQLRGMSPQARRWMMHHLDQELHERFHQALVVIELYNKALTGSLNWTMDVPNQLQHIYTGWDQWSRLVNQIVQEPDQAVALKRLKLAARECQTQAELTIIQTLMDDLAQYLVELGIEPTDKR